MSLNSRFSMDLKKVARFGPIFHTIDFEVSDSLSKEIYLEHGGRHKKRKVGTFLIANSQHKVTINDLKRIINDLSLIEDKTYREKPKMVTVNLFNLNMELTRAEYFRVLETARGALENIEKSYTMGMLY